jgi:hypothetical protein
MTYKDLYRYDAATGDLYRKPRSASEFSSDWHYMEHLKNCQHPVGAKVFRKGVFPVAIMVNPPRGSAGKLFKDTLVHRIIWKIERGEIPEGMVVDHINGNPFDNRLENLRLVTHTENCRNARSHTTNKTGLKGVAWDKKNERWQTEIRTPVGRVFLGRHKTKGEAALVYAKASLRYHGKHSIYARPVPRIGVPQEDLDRMRDRGFIE